MKTILLLDGGTGAVTEIAKKNIFYTYKGDEWAISRELVADTGNGNFKQLREGGEEVDAILTVRRLDGMQYQILATTNNEVIRKLLKEKIIKRTKKGVVTPKNDMLNYAVSNGTISELGEFKIEWKIDYLLY